MGIFQTAVVFIYLMVLGATSNTESDKQQIISQMNLYHTHFHKPNPEALYDQIYLAETYSMPPGEPARRGKGEKVPMLSRFMDTMKEVYVRNDRIEIFGDIAVQVFRYEEDGADGNVLEIGKALMVWKKDSATNKWRILYNIWNES